MTPRSELQALARFYQVTLTAHGISATVVSFPWVPPPNDFGNPSRHLAHALKEIGVVAYRDLNEESTRRTPEVLASATLDNLTESPEDAYRFIRDVFYEPLVPIERSPLSGSSLGDLIRHGPEQVGAVMGAFVAAETEPLLLFITMPGGMIVFGAAAGVAEALHLGLRTKMLGWLGVDDPQAGGDLEGGAPARDRENAGSDDDDPQIRG